jgi:hypothetical protein
MKKNNGRSAYAKNFEVKKIPDLKPNKKEASKEEVAAQTVLDNISDKDQYIDQTIDALLEAQIPTKFVEVSSISLSTKENKEELRNVILRFNKGTKTKLIIPIRSEDGRFTALSLTKNDGKTSISAIYIDLRGTKQKTSSHLREVVDKTTEIGSLPIHIRDTLLLSKIFPKDIKFTTNKIQKPEDNIGETFLIEILKNLATGQMTVKNERLHEKKRDLGDFDAKKSGKAEKTSRLKHAKQLATNHRELSSGKLEGASEGDFPEKASISKIFRATFAAIGIYGANKVINNIKNQNFYRPTFQPISSPSLTPALQPISSPSLTPALQPITLPSFQPISSPSLTPALQPITLPSLAPILQPITLPSLAPILQPITLPSLIPSFKPINKPTGQPSLQPSNQPAAGPSNQPVAEPSNQRSDEPSNQPVAEPSNQPSEEPSNQPAAEPSNQPVAEPSNQPSEEPSNQPVAEPSNQPFVKPTGQPSLQPFSQATLEPSNHSPVNLTTQPSKEPNSQPLYQPIDNAQTSTRPSSQSFKEPSSQPSYQPMDNAQTSAEPSSQSSAVISKSEVTELSLPVQLVISSGAGAVIGSVGSTALVDSISTLTINKGVELAVILGASSVATSASSASFLGATVAGGIVFPIAAGALGAGMGSIIDATTKSPPETRRRLNNDISIGRESKKTWAENLGSSAATGAAGLYLGGKIAQHAFTPESNISSFLALVIVDDFYFKKISETNQSHIDKINKSLRYMSETHIGHSANTILLKDAFSNSLKTFFNNNNDEIDKISERLFGKKKEEDNSHILTLEILREEVAKIKYDLNENFENVIRTKVEENRPKVDKDSSETTTIRFKKNSPLAKEDTGLSSEKFDEVSLDSSPIPEIFIDLISSRHLSEVINEYLSAQPVKEQEIPLGNIPYLPDYAPEHKVLQLSNKILELDNEKSHNPSLKEGYKKRWDQISSSIGCRKTEYYRVDPPLEGDHEVTVEDPAGEEVSKAERTINSAGNELTVFKAAAGRGLKALTGKRESKEIVFFDPKLEAKEKGGDLVSGNNSPAEGSIEDFFIGAKGGGRPSSSPSNTNSERIISTIDTHDRV